MDLSGKNIQEYFKSVSGVFRSGSATEHSYRGFLAELVNSICPDVKAINEPKRQECGAPDYIISRKEIPVGFIEAKDIGVDLDTVEKSEQLKRYLERLDNLILTDYLEFRLFRNGQKVSKVHIGILDKGKMSPDKNQWSALESFIKDFCSYQTQSITSAEKLAKLMAGKAQLLQEAIYKSLTLDNNGNIVDEKCQPAIYETQSQYGASNTLHDQLKAFKKILIHDMDEAIFADIYAQTVVYGMFAARLADPSLDTFTRGEAMFLIPKSNPFLRQLFSYIAGPELDERITWIVDSLADIFRACDIRKILEDFKKKVGQDPMIHFYETFLGEYNPKLRKSRGVYYTPEPVVKFIVRSVDEILKTEFGLPQGLADTSKVEIVTENPYGKGKLKQKVHKVQILDPAVGTGTFLCEVIKQIHAKFANQQGMWNNYVEEHLIPRIHGFEFLMAPYAMCHLKLEMLLVETGYKPAKDQPACASHADRRLSVYLTNSLEEAHPDTQTLFASWLSREAEEANRIKRDCPVMVVLGNPPYSVSSSNKGEWIESLTADYKKDLNERNIQPLSDDYIKFIRFAEHFIEKNGQGIVAMITNNSFIDGIIHRQMRKHLLQSFDSIYILDLHGNSKKKEIAPDGSADQNVFDVMQGVSINLFVKTGKKKKVEFGKVRHFELFGKREYKYDNLNKNYSGSISWNELGANEPNYFFVKKDFITNNGYAFFIKITDLFDNYSAGIQSKRDGLFIDDNIDQLERRICKLINQEVDPSFINEFNVTDSSSYKLTRKIKQVRYDTTFIKRSHYRPFDDKYIYYDPDLIGRSFFPVMKNLLHSENLGLVISKQFIDSFKYVFVSNKICDMNLISSAGSFGAGFSFPLYLYPSADELDLVEGKEKSRVPNLDMEIVAKFAEKIGVAFKSSVDIPVCDSMEANSNDGQECPSYFTPENLLDYIYAVLHSPNYREKYKEFLKIDFPRIPLPENSEQFWKFVEKGCELRKLHLMESPELDTPITTYPASGSNVVEKIAWSVGVPPGDAVAQASRPCSSDISPIPAVAQASRLCSSSGRVFINPTQYFDNVPEVSWNFYIGGYQPAQKWLKDRKGRTLSYNDIIHYQKVIVALKRTAEVMEEIDGIKDF